MAATDAATAKLASGISPVEEFLEKDVKVCIGTDGSASNNSLNMLEEVKFGALMQKVKYNDPMAGKIEDFYQMATLNGAYALGREDELGSIEVGKKADIVTFPIDHILLPDHNLLSNLVYAGSGLKASNVLINGKLLIEEGKLIVCEEKKIIEDFNNMTVELMKRVQEDK